MKTQILISITFSLFVSPAFARSPDSVTGGIMVAQLVNDVGNRNAALRRVAADIVEMKTQRLGILDRSTTALQQSLRTNGCRKVDIDSFTSLTVQFEDYGIEALRDAKKYLEAGGPDAEYNSRSEILYARRNTETLNRSRLNFANTALERGCTDIANLLYRHVFAYGPPEFSKRAELGMRDVAAKRLKQN
jgi:hypothetical protein